MIYSWIYIESCSCGFDELIKWQKKKETFKYYQIENELYQTVRKSFFRYFIFELYVYSVDPEFRSIIVDLVQCIRPEDFDL